ncbi:pilus assembly protein TadG-related protein [Actinomadura alba]|uniref:Pilus assembly protein n=1 Tax=Actinomadura alba TaxID=406431 RepID=A0ABR7LIU3_9ACTN|nr:pilus assembly protein TadG-related protein [Actinomadura alba]MBC6464708.1 pilus assembly protein [Actinomadura alba]
MFTVIFALFVILLAGLLVDGGLAIHARQRAADIAEQAARAAADDIDVGLLRTTGELRIADAGTACAKARRLVARYPEAGDVQCGLRDSRTAWVQVKITVKLQLLSIMPGFSDMEMTSSATATPETGT